MKLTELNSAVLNICQNMAGNIVQVEFIFPKVEKQTQNSFLPPPRGNAEWEAKKEEWVSERDINVGDRSFIAAWC